MIKILYSNFNSQFSPNRFNYFLKSLPESLKEKVMKYHRWQDQYSSLFGKLLLRRGLEMFDMEGSELEYLEYTSYTKPYLRNGLRFNISHSGALVICVLSDDLTVGIDTERVTEIEIEDFKNQWSHEEWKNIKSSENRNHEFFRYWTRKEAIIKANGKGLSLPLRDFDVIGNMVEVESQMWYLREIEVLNDYVVHLASDREVKNSELMLINIDFYKRDPL